MKTLRRVMIMAVFIIGVTAVTGCKDSNASDNQQSAIMSEQPEQVDDKGLDFMEQKQVSDSSNVVVPQTETSSKAQETNNNGSGDVSKSVADLKGESHLFDLISWVIAAIALLVAVISLIKLNSVQKRADRHRKDIGELERKICLLDQKINLAPTRNKTANVGIGSSEYTKLDSRIYKIERQLDTMNHGSVSDPKNIPSSNPGSDVRSFVKEQTGYFGLPTQMSLTEAYFKRLSDSRESDSRFTVEVRNDKAEFRPLEGPQYLNDLKSNDATKMAFAITGCALSEATQMRIILPGEAKKDGDRWIITKKTTIVLSR